VRFCLVNRERKVFDGKSIFGSRRSCFAKSAIPTHL
jgi:hypothetical protein